MTVKIVASKPPYFIGETWTLSAEDESILVSDGVAEFLQGEVSITSLYNGDATLAEESIVTAVTNPLTGVIEISGVPVAPLVVVADGGSGATSGWIQTSASPERFALELTIATGGAAASLTLDGSNDGQTSAAQIATASLDTTGVQTITPPIKPLYPWIRWTVVFAGSGNVKIARGA